VSPDGTQNADKIIESNTNANHNVNQSFTAVVSAVYTASVYAKAEERTAFRISRSGGSVGAGFNLTTQQISAAAGATATITDAGNGWYRCTMSFTAVAVGQAVYLELQTAFSGSSESYQGDGTSGMYFWGAQLEVGAFATSYIPTTTTALTRNADVATMTGTNFSDWYNQSEGTFVFDGSSFNTSGISTYYFSALGVGGDNIQAFAFGSTIRPLYVDTPSGAQVRLISSVSSVGSYKFAAAYKVDSFAASISAGSPLTDTLGTVPTTVNKLNIGSAASNLLQLGGHVRKFLYYPQRLINAELQSFSK
jgi:hypothetical protein